MSAIVPNIPSIYYAISTNNVVEVVAPTGTGKSTLIPLSLALAGNRVMVAVPTRTAATNIASVVRRFAAGRISVGSAADQKILYNNDTNLVYATSGHVRRLVLGRFTDGRPSNWQDFNVLVLDEVQNGTVDNSIIIGLWLKASSTEGIRFPRLILITATPVDIVGLKPPRVSVEVGSFPVEIRYKQDYSEFKVIEAIVNEAISIHATADKDHHILVFVAGKPEIDKVIEGLRSIRDALVLPLYGDMEESESVKVHEPAPNYKRKVIVATNVAETSITIEGIYYVLDSMLEKRAGTSAGGGSSLITHYISKNSANQRKGRTGRTNPGTCIRFISENKYEKLQNERPAEVLRVPIYNELMEILNAGLDPVEILAGVPISRVKEAIQLMKNCDMLVPITGGIQVTESGIFASKSRLGLRLAAFLYTWIQEGLDLYHGVVLASLIECNPSALFIIPAKGPNQQGYNEIISRHHNQKYPDIMGQDQIETLLRLWNSLITRGGLVNLEKTQGYYNRLNNWCTTMEVNKRAAHELISTVSSLLSHLSGGYRGIVNVGEVAPDAYVQEGRLILLRYFRDRVASCRNEILTLNNSRYTIDKWSIPTSHVYQDSQYIVLQSWDKITESSSFRLAKLVCQLPESQ